MEVITKKVLGDRCRRQRYKTLGLCCDCGNPVWNGLVRCKDCITQHKLSELKRLPAQALYKKLYYQQQKIEGKCVRCGIFLIEGEVIECCNCASPNRISMRQQGVLKYETAD